MDPQLKSIVEAGVHGSEYLSGYWFCEGLQRFSRGQKQVDAGWQVDLCDGDVLTMEAASLESARQTRV